MRRVAVLLFNEVEVLDFAGPFEVFTLARTAAEVRARGGLVVKPSHTLGAHPPIDILIVPGGVVDEPLADPAVIAWIAAQSRTAEITASVCTGAFLTGKAGLLDGRKATTHWEDLADLRAALPETTVVDGVPFVDEGRIISSAGISAGIEMSLHLVERLHGRRLAELTARQMQYDRRQQPELRSSAACLGAALGLAFEDQSKLKKSKAGEAQ